MAFKVFPPELDASDPEQDCRSNTSSTEEKGLTGVTNLVVGMGFATGGSPESGQGGVVGGGGGEGGGAGEGGDESMVESTV